jgi:hypothetical protein
MLPIQPIGERSAVTPLYGVSGAPAVAAPPPPGIAVDVSPFGQLLGTLALAQRRLEDLSNRGEDANADIAQLGVAAGELTEAFNLGRALPLPGQAALPARLTSALETQQEALAQAGIAVADDGRLQVDSERLLAAFDSNRQATLATLTQAAARFAATGDAPAPARQETPPAAVDKPPVPVTPASTAAAPERAAAPPTVAAAEVTDRADESTTQAAVATAEAARRAEAAAEQAAAAATAAAARLAEAADERAAAAAAATEAAQRLHRQTTQAEAARADAQRLADLQVGASLAEASQAALTREARQAAYRLEVAREVANVQIAVQDDIATQDQRLAEVRAAALRQLTSSEEEDLAAQALADRLARQRDATAAAALTPDEQDAQERLMAVRRAAAGTAHLPQEGTIRPADTAIGIDSAPLAGDGDVAPVAREASAAAAASRPLPPNAADPALAAAIAAQMLAGGVPGSGTNAAPPPRAQLVTPVRPVTRMTAAEGDTTKPRGGA